MSKSTRVIWEKNHINGELFLQNRGTSETLPRQVMHESRVKKHPGDLGKKSYQRGIFLQNRGNSAIDRRSSVRAIDNRRLGVATILSPCPFCWNPGPTAATSTCLGP